MKKICIAFGALGLLCFLFFVFVAFNKNTALLILTNSIEDDFFREKAIRVFESLMILIFYIILSSSFLLFNQKIINKYLSFVMAGNVIVCLLVYWYVGIFPISMPTINN